MASYFRWIKGSKKEESLYQKPRSRSLDGKSLELSGIKLLLHHVGTNSDFLMLLGLQFKPLDLVTIQTLVFHVLLIQTSGLNMALFQTLSWTNFG
jgi:hypothetical protein